MSVAQNPETKLMEKIRSLPPDKITVLEDFIDFLLTRSEARLLVYTATKLSEAARGKRAIEPAPEEGFANASQSFAEVLGFSDVEQSLNAIPII